MRRPMRAARTLTQSQWPSRATAPLQIFSITFIMSAMVGRYLPQLKMPRLAAYARDAGRELQAQVSITLLSSRKPKPASAARQKCS